MRTGLDRLGAPGAEAVEKAAAGLSRIGFKAVAALLAGHGEARAADGDRPARVRAWADASTAVVGRLESAG
jgi:hypothetical protein